MPEYDGRACARCHVRAPGIGRVRTALIYEYPVDQLAMQAKFRSRADYAFGLGELLAVYLRAARLRCDLHMPDALIPVPLHPRRLAARGFNQAEEIAAPLAREFGLAVLTRGCRRVIDTAAQTTLTGAERRKNIRGAFRVTAGVAGARVVIVDDVLTTGTTVAEFASTLTRSGARSVGVWAAARSEKMPRKTT